MAINLNDVLNATGDGGAKIISQQHDPNNITWQNGVKDLLEMGGQTGIAAGLRRANLNVANGRVSMFSAFETPWHGLGIVLSQVANSLEALQYANLAGWSLQKIQQQYAWDGRLLPTDRYAIVRSDNGAYLGCVGSKYAIVQNEECFDFMDKVIEGGAKYETAGAIGKGERVWMLARMPEKFDIKGDEVENYILFSTSHDGTASIGVFPTNVRVVCANTFRMAMNDKRRGISIRHSKNVKSKMHAAQEALNVSRREFARFTEQANMLAGVQIEPMEYFSTVLDDILDVTIAGQEVTSRNTRNVLDAILNLKDKEEQMSAKKQLDRILVRRKELLGDILNRYESERNNGNQAIAGTAWAAFNAVTETVDHGSLLRYNGTPTEKRESAFESAIYGKGDEVKATAFNLALQATR